MQKRTFWVGLLLVLSLSFSLWCQPAIAAREDRQLVSQAWSIVNRAYLDETFNHQNWWSVRQKLLKEPLKNSEAAYTAIQKMLASLDDPFTRLLKPEQYRSLQVNTSGELTGVGLQIALDGETGEIVVIAPIAGSPAEKAGIAPSDRILKINDINAMDLTLDEAAARMRGKIGTSVTIEVRHPNATSEAIAIVRDRIALNPVYATLDRTNASNPIGYIRLSQFSANATVEVAHAIARLEKQGAQSYILDLRNNPGGLLQAGIEIARLWLEEGTIVYTVNRQGTLGSFDAFGGAITNAPLAVLVNKGSASASEILAGALQDNGRAQLVGEKTFGKGLIQSLFDLSDGSGLAITVAKYETPNHHDIHKLGIKPDREVPLEAIAFNQIGTANDPQYKAAVELLSHQAIAATSNNS